MLLRAAAVAVVALAVSGCANDRSVAMMGLGFHGGASADAAPTPRPASASVNPRVPAGELTEMKQTLGGKVLSAIALERVTGRKPDPSRLRELR